MNIRVFTIILFLLSGVVHKSWSQNELKDGINEFKIKPSLTDATITQGDIEHLVIYDASNKEEKLFLFLPGTKGIPVKGPRKLFETAISQGYRVINLSYLNALAVAKICKGENLKNDIECTEKFREQRVFGTQKTSLIPDKPQDAIVPRFTKLLQYLVANDPKGNWETYIDNDIVRWDKITVTGQSQGGGMAAFIAKNIKVNKIITFSGGWDYTAKDTIARWYHKESITPLDRWYGFYHIKEPKAIDIAKTYKAMQIPTSQVYALDLPIREGKRAHGEGIRNTVYTQLWVDILDDKVQIKQ